MFGFRHFARSGRAASGTGLVPVPFAIAGAAMLLFFITLPLDGVVGGTLATHHPWLSIGSIDDALAILGAILGVVSTVLALILSITLLVFSMAVSQFGPRLMPQFLRDRTMQITLGLLRTRTRLVPKLYTEDQRCAFAAQIEATREIAAHGFRIGLDKDTINMAYRLACDRLAAHGADAPLRWSRDSARRVMRVGN